MENDSQKVLILEILEVLLASWWTIVAGVCVGASLAFIALRFAIPVYEAEARIEADVEKLPPDFVRRTVSDDVELQLRKLSDQVLSAENLKGLIPGVFGQPQSTEHEEELIDVLRSGLFLNYSRNTRTISVRFRDQVPRRAADVANLLAELFVTENKVLRASGAKDVRESLESLASEDDSELLRKKAELTQLLVNHPHELESQRQANESAIDRLQTALDQNEKAVESARRRLSVLKSQRDVSARDVPAGEGPASVESPLTSADSRIAVLEQEIEALLTKFTDNHPSVVAKRREIQRLRSAATSPEPAIPTAPDSDESIRAPALPSGPAIDAWTTRVRAAELELARMEEQGRETQREIGRYRSYLANTPIIQQRVESLMARVQMIEQTYLQNQRLIETAKAGQELEETDIANPFVIGIYASPPSERVFPNRLVFLGSGVAGGLLLFVGPLLVLALLQPRIRAERSLTLLADIPVLVVIPEIPTPEVARVRRRLNVRNFGFSALSVVMLIAVLVTHYAGSN